MKTSEILDKVTLEFAGGGKLALSDYAPYISNGEVEVKELGGGIKDLFKLFYNISPDGLCSREWKGNEYENTFISLDSIKNINLSIYTNNYDSCLYFLYKLDNPDINNVTDNEIDNTFNYPVPDNIEISYNGQDYYLGNIVTRWTDYGWEEVNVLNEGNTETYYICTLKQK